MMCWCLRFMGRRLMNRCCKKRRLLFNQREKVAGAGVASTLRGDAEGAFWLDKAVGHARGVKGGRGAAIAVEQDQAAGAGGAMGGVAGAGGGDELRGVLGLRGGLPFLARCAG